MLLKKIIVYCIMALYLYTLAFGIFMTDKVKVPAPIIFGLLLLFFLEPSVRRFAYYRESALFTFALFFYYIVGMDDYKSFFACLVIILVCAFYFNYFVGLNKLRFKVSVILFYSLLLLSMLIMVLDHNYQNTVDALRSTMLDEKVKQSPAGLSITQFIFGYQVAAFTTFVFVLVCVLRKNILIKALAFCVCAICLYLGMNRSAFISFGSALVVFLFAYYRFKAVFIIAATVLIGFAIYTYVLKDNLDNKNNILAKNEAKEANDYNRVNLADENLKIYEDYPFGLIFYGTNWDEATYKNPVFTFGLTSHNAYLMYITYLGPFLGLGLLWGIYHKAARFFWQTIHQIHLKNNALPVALLFSFLGVSLNALSHNAWLISADGPTLFLYFSIMQCSKIYMPVDSSVAALNLAVAG